MGQRQISRREQEERRKKEEEIAAASVSIECAVANNSVSHHMYFFNVNWQVFKEFVETFEGGSSSSKVWVKAGTYDAGSRSKPIWIIYPSAMQCVM